MGYTWEFERYVDIWCNDVYDTIEECLKDAKEEADEDQKVVYIGRCTPYVLEADCTYILERMQEEAGDACGEIGGDWCAFDWHKKGELEELNDLLTTVVHNWMKKYGYYPTFFNVENVKEYSLEV